MSTYYKGIYRYSYIFICSHILAKLLFLLLCIAIVIITFIVISTNSTRDLTDCPICVLSKFWNRHLSTCLLQLFKAYNSLDWKDITLLSVKMKEWLSLLQSDKNHRAETTNSDSIQWLWQSLFGETRWWPLIQQTYKSLPPYRETILTVVSILVMMNLTRKGFRRFPTATDIPSRYFRKKSSLRGRIVAVNDSDNVRFYHESVLMRWFPGSWWGQGAERNRKRGTQREETINVRLAGIDAPEMGHFGGTSQPFAQEAKDWLTKLTVGKQALITVHRLDQYGRAVASLRIQKWWWWWSEDVSLAMVKAGWAMVYGGAGAEYGSAEMEKKLRQAEEMARSRARGMWKYSSLTRFISPAEYKRQRLLKWASSNSAINTVN